MRVPTHRLPLPLVAAALLGTAAPGCSSEPPTVQLVVRAVPAVAELLLEVRVRVTAVIRTTGGDVVVCIPCERIFHPAAGATADQPPIVVDFVRNATPYQEAWFDVSYRWAGGTGHLYHRMTWPDEGVTSHSVEIQSVCLSRTCDPGWHCIDGTCHLSVPEVPDEILDEAWGTRACSDTCDRPSAADADVPAEAEAEAGADFAAEADTPPPP